MVLEVGEFPGEDLVEVGVELGGEGDEEGREEGDGGGGVGEFDEVPLEDEDDEDGGDHEGEEEQRGEGGVELFEGAEVEGGVLEVHVVVLHAADELPFEHVAGLLTLREPAQPVFLYKLFLLFAPPFDEPDRPDHVY